MSRVLVACPVVPKHSFGTHNVQARLWDEIDAVKLLLTVTVQNRAVTGPRLALWEMQACLWDEIGTVKLRLTVTVQNRAV
ncbi:hypothetical protein AVEN_102516-1, partial [Araneus ventricosus]